MKKMRPSNYIKTILIFLSVVLLASCEIFTSDVKKSSKTAKYGNDTQELAALAFISYAGEKLKLDDTELDQILPACIRNEIQHQPITRNKFQLVWGPAAYRFPFAQLSDNMMYVVKDTRNSGNLIVAIRGTNAGAALDWLVEDFYVNKTKAWDYGSNVPANTLISEATYIGLSILQALKPVWSTSPGYNMTVTDYLRSEISKGTLQQVTLVGHSLAGALAPTYALWLKDTQPIWDPAGKVAIKVTALAGATPGNKQFSDYYGSRLGNQTDRAHNPFDAVPQAWYLPTMEQLPHLYASAGIHATVPEKLLVDVSVELAKNTSYTQILPQQPPLSGKINTATAYSKFIEQVGWQHSCGYYCALGIANSMLNVNSECLSESYCQRNPTAPNCKALNELRCTCPQ